MKIKWLREVRSTWILRKWSSISEKGYSGIIPFVYEGKDLIHKYMQYEVSITVYMGRIAIQRKVPKCCHLKNTSQNH